MIALSSKQIRKHHVSIWREFVRLEMKKKWSSRFLSLESSLYFNSKPNLVLNMLMFFLHTYIQSKLKTNVESCVERYHPSSVVTTLKAVLQLLLAGFVFIRKASVIAALVTRSKGLLIQVHYWRAKWGEGEDINHPASARVGLRMA